MNYRELQKQAQARGIRANRSKAKLQKVLANSGPGISGPNLSAKSLEVGFVRKVYGILSLQLLLTTAVAYICTIETYGIRQFVVENAWPWLDGPVYFISIGLLFALFCFRKSFPANMILLTAWTFALSLNIGLVSAIYMTIGQGEVLLQAAGMTLGIFVGLTVFTFKSKYDFSWMGGILFTVLWGMILASLLSMIFGFTLGVLYSYLGAVLFSFFIMFDTHRLLQELDYDEYIEASIQLYLDIINLFLHILRILSKKRKK